MGGIEFRVLGPVEILEDGRRVGPAAAQLRCVLAMLLLDLDRVVSLGRLVSALWTAAPPVSARNCVRVHVTRLRKLLAADPAVSIATVGEGWRLSCDPAKVDLYRFRDLVDRARSGPPEEAGALLREALRLWRGPALADATGGALTGAVSAGLEDERLTAVEDRIEHDLRSGEHDVVPELSVLVAEHPLRERPARMLMSALHRGGRTAEALAVFQETRKRFVDELGIEPGPALQRELRIILNGPEEERAEAPGGAPLPRQLPGDVGVFAGRARHLSGLDELLDLSVRQGKPLLALIAGIPGAGKTTLAVHWAHRVRDRFPDGQLFLNLRGFDASGEAVDPADGVARFLGALGVPAAEIPAGLDDRAALYRSLLADRRMLIVLDNARDEAQVRPLLPGSAGSCVIVTARDTLPGLAAQRATHLVDLGVFDRAEARELLAGRLGAARVRAEPEAVAQLIDRCAGLPLPLAMVAARAAARTDFPLASLVEDLAGPVLDAFESPDPAVDLRTVFSWSLAQAKPEAAQLFRLLGLHWGPDFTAEAAAALAGRPVRDVKRSLRELCRMQLLAERTAGRFELHDLLAAYAAELAHTLDDPAAVREAARRLLDHYLHTARAAAALMAPHRSPIRLPDPAPGALAATIEDGEQATAWFDAERHVLAHSLTAAQDHGIDAYVWALPQFLATHLRRAGLGPDWLATQRRALAAADRTGDAWAQAVTRYGLAAAEARYGDPLDAERRLHEALRGFEALGDLEWQANTHLMLCVTSENADDDAAALAHAQESLALFSRAGVRHGQARALNNIGHTRARLGEYALALRACSASLRISGEIGDTAGAANTLDSLGFVHFRTGDYEQAVRCYRRSFDHLNRNGERYLAAVTLERLGDAHAAAGDRHAAFDAWLRAFRAFQDLDHPNAAGVRAKLNPPAMAPLDLWR